MDGIMNTYTSLLPSGRLTMANCSSLYFLNVGWTDCSRLGSLLVRALMSDMFMSHGYSEDLARSPTCPLSQR